MSERTGRPGAFRYAGAMSAAKDYHQIAPVILLNPSGLTMPYQPELGCNDCAGKNQVPELRQHIWSPLLEGLSLDFAKLASFAKNTDMGLSRINFISVRQEEQKRCRISR